MSNIATDVLGNDVNSSPLMPSRQVKTSYASAQSVTVGNLATVTLRTFYPLGYQWFGAAINASELKESHSMAPDWMVVSFRPTSAYSILGRVQLSSTAMTTIQTTVCAAGVPVITWFPDLYADTVQFQCVDTGAVGELLTVLIVNMWRPR